MTFPQHFIRLIEYCENSHYRRFYGEVFSVLCVASFFFIFLAIIKEIKFGIPIGIALFAIDFIWIWKRATRKLKI